jgi:hypothetical protein
VALSTYCFDLEHQICGTDFYGWLIEHVHRGATEIVFRTAKWRPIKSYPDHIMRRRFETMIAPGPAFLGLSSREGEDGERGVLGYKNIHFFRFARECQDFQRLRSVLPPKTARYTVTIREAIKSQWRNSNKAVWLQFAKEIGAHVIQDYEIEPMHIHELFAFYAGAEMNFGVWGGPLWMCSLTKYPCMIFKLDIFRWHLERHGAIFGENLPWCRDNQTVFWEGDTLDNLRTRFRQYIAAAAL